MTYWSLIFIGLFLPLTVLIYNLLPQKHRGKLLLIASYIFFWSISDKLIIYLLITTLFMYFFGKWFNKIQAKRDFILKDTPKENKKSIKEIYKKKQRKILIFTILVQVGILIVLKYSTFLGTNINTLLQLLNLNIEIPITEFLIPIGISFYTLQAISYIMDVYKEKIKADNNLGRLALFISFFPQIMEGPICRYSQTAEKLWEGTKTTSDDLRYGIQRILWGLMKKAIIADRLNLFVLEIFNNYHLYDGGMIAIGMILYTLQLYADFSGTMDIAIGIGHIFGVKIPENFRQPFFSKSISDFWTRWHITLGTWLRDYIYYPVSLSNICKKITTKARKKIGNYYGPIIASSVALFAVWICNGIWHGSAWNYIFFGMYHFSIILSGKIFEPLFKKITEILHINRKHFIYTGFQIVRTTCLVFIGELFFRANGLVAGFQMFSKMITNFSLNSITSGSVFYLGIGRGDFLVLAIATILLFIVGILKERGMDVNKSICNKNIVIRWIIYYIIILAIIVFGGYGVGYKPVEPMYAQF